MRREGLQHNAACILLCSTHTPSPRSSKTASWSVLAALSAAAAASSRLHPTAGPLLYIRQSSVPGARCVRLIARSSCDAVVAAAAAGTVRCRRRSAQVVTGGHRGTGRREHSSRIDKAIELKSALEPRNNAVRTTHPPAQTLVGGGGGTTTRGAPTTTRVVNSKPLLRLAVHRGAAPICA